MAQISCVWRWQKRMLRIKKQVEVSRLPATPPVCHACGAITASIPILNCRVRRSNCLFATHINSFKANEREFVFSLLAKKREKVNGGNCGWKVRLRLSGLISRRRQVYVLALSLFESREVIDPKHAKQDPHAHLRQVFPITCSCVDQWNLKAIIVKLCKKEKRVKKSRWITSLATEGTIFPLMRRDKTNPQPQKSPSEEKKRRSPVICPVGLWDYVKCRVLLAKSKFFVVVVVVVVAQLYLSISLSVQRG